MKTKQHKQDIGYGNQCLSEENLFFFYYTSDNLSDFGYLLLY